MPALGDERGRGGARHLPVGAPVVERIHQRALGDDGQFAERERTVVQMRPCIAVERRVGARVAGQRQEPRVRRGGDGGRAQRPRPDRLRRQRRGAPRVDGGTHGIAARGFECDVHAAV
jgi:hypothetical protein